MIQPSSSSSYGNPSIQFVDTVQTNVQVDIDFLSLVFMDVNGDQQQLKNVVGKKNTIVVITRGFAGSNCPYCTTQTSRLISNYAKFTKLDAEVVVVYPMQSLDDRSKLDEFLKSTRRLLSDPATPVPFPILLDVGLNVVGQLGIRHDLSKPATYILGKNGRSLVGFRRRKTGCCRYSDLPA